MNCSQLVRLKIMACIGLLSCVYELSALEFKPGVGVGLELTDNATLEPTNVQEDLIVIGYLGASLLQEEGPFLADITASLNHHRYTKDSFEDQRYFNLGATADWAMINNRFNWLIRNYYTQRPINTTEPNTPDNIQDTNALTLGANIIFPISARQTFTLLPEYRNFYYEIQLTDNQQYSLLASWSYELSNLTSVGWNASVRTVDYKEPLIDDVSFTSIFFSFSSLRARSDVRGNIGSTYVNRSNGQSTAEFAGDLNWLVNLSSRSRVRTFIATDLTDSSTGELMATVDPEVGDPNNIQITTDVIRNQVISLGYHRLDGVLESGLTAEFRQLNYSESPNDRRVFSVNALVNYPLTALLRSELYANYSNSDYIDIDRVDDDSSAGGRLRYQLSRSFHSVVDLRYRNRDSTLESNNFSEWSVYASLTYGFGEPLRPSRSGGF